MQNMRMMDENSELMWMGGKRERAWQIAYELQKQQEDMKNVMASSALPYPDREPQS